LLYKVFHRPYVNKGLIAGQFWLNRASKEQKSLIENIFHSKVIERWSEILFKPELKLNFAGQENSLVGRVDALLSNNIGLFRSIARQHSFHCIKP